MHMPLYMKFVSMPFSDLKKKSEKAIMKLKNRLQVRILFSYTYVMFIS